MITYNPKPEKNPKPLKPQTPTKKAHKDHERLNSAPTHQVSAVVAARPVSQDLPTVDL